MLDNCEHVIGGVAQVADYLLARCPGLRILATSRESLAVAGESVWPLQPLAVDAASELFVARADAIAPRFRADEHAMATISEICARLDGLPLAIELAAVRVRALDPGDILARLADQFRLLTGGTRTALPRHQTLRGVIDWSYDLLFDDERRVFERMSAFAGPCPLAAAEQVCAGAGTCGIGWFWATGGAIGSFEDCWRWLTASLALPQPVTGRRVRALAFAEQIALAQGREDALAYGEQAVELGQASGDRPARAFAVWLHGSALAGVFGQRNRAIRLLEEAGALLEAEADDWSVGLAALTRGVAALTRPDPDHAQLLLRGAAEWFARTGNVLAQGAVLRHLADLAVLRGRYDDAIAALEEMVSILPAESHPAGIIRMAQLGCLYAFQDRPGQSDRWHARAEAAAEDQQHLHLLVFACNARGLTLLRLGHLKEAEACHRQALELCREHNIPEGLAMARSSLGYIAELHEDTTAAEQHHRASLHAAREVADRQAQALALEGLAGAASLRGYAAATGRLLGAASAFREGTVGTVMGQGTPLRETIIGRLSAAEHDATGTATARVGDRAAFDAAYAEGLRDPLAVLRAARG